MKLIKQIVTSKYPWGTLEIEYSFPNPNACPCGGEFKDTIEKTPVTGCYSDDVSQKEFIVGYNVTQRCSKCGELRETMSA